MTAGCVRLARRIPTQQVRDAVAVWRSSGVCVHATLSFVRPQPPHLVVDRKDASNDRFEPAFSTRSVSSQAVSPHRAIVTSAAHRAARIGLTQRSCQHGSQIGRDP